MLAHLNGTNARLRLFATASGVGEAVRSGHRYQRLPGNNQR